MTRQLDTLFIVIKELFEVLEDGALKARDVGFFFDEDLSLELDSESLFGEEEDVEVNLELTITPKLEKAIAKAFICYLNVFGITENLLMKFGATHAALNYDEGIKVSFERDVLCSFKENISRNFTDDFCSEGEEELLQDLIFNISTTLLGRYFVEVGYPSSFSSYLSGVMEFGFNDFLPFKNKDLDISRPFSNFGGEIDTIIKLQSILINGANGNKVIFHIDSLGGFSEFLNGPIFKGGKVSYYGKTLFIPESFSDSIKSLKRLAFLKNTKLV